MISLLARINFLVAFGATSVTEQTTNAVYVASRRSLRGANNSKHDHRTRLEGAGDVIVGVRASGAALNLFQWNPHYQCFSEPAECSQEVQDAISAKLDGSVDIANIIELEPATPYQAPSPYKAIASTAGLDTTTLFYNSDRWEVASQNADINLKGGTDASDRAAVVVTLTSKTGGQNIVVAGAHYSHDVDFSSNVLKESIGSVPAGYGFVLLADTNVNEGVSNEEIFAKLGMSVGADTPTESTTCCYGNWVDGYNFDRIITTLQGTGAVSVGDVVANPGAEQHKPIMIAIETTAEVVQALDIGVSASGAALNLFQWNPHYQCFSEPAECSQEVQDAISAKLDGSVDIANIIELEPATPYQAPSPYKAIASTAGLDTTTLFYNSDRWEVASQNADINLKGGTDASDRAAVVVTLTSKTGGQNIVVAGAHYSHDVDFSSNVLKESIGSVPAGYGFVLLADTNVNEGVSNEEIFAKLGMSVGADTPTESTTCCYGNWVDGYNFDRIITTLQGTGAVSVGDVVANPGAEQHKPVMITMASP